VIAEAVPSDAISRVLADLRAGRVVGVPTDTVYGLAARANDASATSALFALKERPERVELPVLVSDMAQARSFADVSGTASRLAERFWPGALTIVVTRRGSEGWLLGGRGDTVGVRCPDMQVLRSLCTASGPLATTSANRHGAAPLTDADAVRAQFGDAIGEILDGGVCAGRPSTVVDVTGEIPVLVRPGALSWDEVLTVVLG
jgi:L-threonylcarbamoyladenylate synthase